MTAAARLRRIAELRFGESNPKFWLALAELVEASEEVSKIFVGSHAGGNHHPINILRDTLAALEAVVREAEK